MLSRQKAKVILFCHFQLAINKPLLGIGARVPPPPLQKALSRYPDLSVEATGRFRPMPSGCLRKHPDFSQNFESPPLFSPPSFAGPPGRGSVPSGRPGGSYSRTNHQRERKGANKATKQGNLSANTTGIRMTSHNMKFSTSPAPLLSSEQCREVLRGGKSFTVHCAEGLWKFCRTSLAGAF